MRILMGALLISLASLATAAPNEIPCQRQVNEILGKLNRPPLESQKYKFTRPGDDSVYGFTGLLESFEKSQKSLPQKRSEFKEDCERFGFLEPKSARPERPPQEAIAEIMKGANPPPAAQPKEAEIPDPLTVELLNWRQARDNCSSRQIDPCKRELEKYLSDGVKRVEAKMKSSGVKIPADLAPGDDGGLLNADKYAGDILRMRADCAMAKLELERIESGKIPFEACAVNGKNTPCSEGREELQNLLETKFALQMQVNLLQDLVPKDKAKLYEHDTKKLRELDTKIKETEDSIQDTVVEFNQRVSGNNLNYQYYILVSPKEDAPLGEIIVDTPSCKVTLPGGATCDNLPPNTYAFGACPKDQKHPQDKAVYTESATGR